MAEIIKFEIISTGQFVREIVKKEFNDDLASFEKYCEQHPEKYQEIDMAILNKVKSTEANVVCDWRLGFHFLPESLKNFVYCDESIVVQRLKNRTDLKDKSDHEILAFIRFRNQSSLDRFKSLYRVDYTDLQHYNLIVDNSKDVEETLEKIIS